MFYEVLPVESGKVVNIVSQVATLVDKGLDVSLELRPIEELQFFW